GRLDELTLEAPLVLPERGGVRLQVLVGAEQDGLRPLRIDSRPADAAEDEPWTRHASGTLAAATDAAADESAVDLTAWPPAGATPLDVTDAYQRLADAGVDYGPAFQGLRAAWQHGDQVYAEVALPATEQAAAARYGLHPALLDAALHAMGLVPDAEQGRLAFSWGGIRLHASGATALRVRLARTAPETLSLTVADLGGAPVASVDSLLLRPVSAERLRTADRAVRESLLRIEWLPVPAGDPAARSWTLLGTDSTDRTDSADRTDGTDRTDCLAALAELGSAVDAGAAVPDVVAVELAPHQGSEATDELAAAVGATTVRVLRLVQEWLVDPRFAEARLAVLTRGAVATGEGAPDPVLAAVWGLVRSAQSENPDRLVLVDHDGGELPLAALPVDTEPQLAVRRGALLAPRLAKAPTAAGKPGAGEQVPLDVSGTVLVTGAIGGLGELTARHLVAAHGARHLLLTSRRGPAAE
ncbi:polyketide synthase dehydratase domain-containing protein, partial [Kitasatospora sp. MY 5-36]|uniref:polyketide synthase dehydratase domain-containing protein n=1 Tax=Kitasatospora sp. MY 5-36 TaxID=1678027 RepID=UPI000670AC17